MLSISDVAKKVKEIEAEDGKMVSDEEALKAAQNIIDWAEFALDMYEEDRIKNRK